MTLDDVLIEEGRIAAFSESETTHVAMGRFGNTMLIAGEPDLSLQAKRGEVVRFYFTNTANTRVFNVTLPGARMKPRWRRQRPLREGRAGRRGSPGALRAGRRRRPLRGAGRASDRASDARGFVPARGDRGHRRAAEPDLSDQFANLRTNSDMEAARERVMALLDAPPDKTLSFVAEMDDVGLGAVDTGVYACPCILRSSPPGRTNARSAA